MKLLYRCICHILTAQIILLNLSCQWTCPVEKEGQINTTEVLIQFTLQVDSNVYKQSKYKKPPQFAIWLENEAKGIIKTLWVTEKTGKGAWGGQITRPVSLPFWVSRWNSETDSDSFPTPENPVIDAITGATPVELLQIEIKVPRDTIWSYYIEINASGDYNSAFPEKYSDGQRDKHGNGQPSLVYRGTVKAVQGQISTPDLIGRTKQFTSVNTIENDLSGITSAKKLLAKMEVSCMAENLVLP